MLFSKVELLDREKHKDLKWRCLKGSCPQSCCLVPDKTFVVLDEVIPLSRHFPKEDNKGCIYLREGFGCLIEEEKPYMDFTCPGFSQWEGERIWERDFVNPHFEQDFYAYSLRIENFKAKTEEFLDSLFRLELVVGGRISYVDEERLIKRFISNR